MESIEKQLSDEFTLPQEHVSNILSLLDNGNSVSFIAKYRKESHDSMDTQMVRALNERRNALAKLHARKKQVEQAIQKKGCLTPNLSAAIASAETLSEVEGLYLPYKGKRRSKAATAREKGLEELAKMLLENDDPDCTSEEISKKFLKNL